MTKKVPDKVILPLFDQRMIEVMNHVIKNEINGINSRTKFLVAVGFTSYNSYSQVTNGSQSFRLEHFMKAVELFGVDANFFFDKKHTKLFKDGTTPKPVMTELREIVSRIAVELKKQPKEL